MNCTYPECECHDGPVCEKPMVDLMCGTDCGTPDLCETQGCVEWPVYDEAKGG